MNIIISALVKTLGYVMDFCYNLSYNYTLSIIIFTLLTKIILLPVSIWAHKNSIKMLRLMPEINSIKEKYYGDKDMIAEEQHAIYKRENYHAFASVIPMLIQIIILLGLVRVINDIPGGTSLSLVPAEAKGVTLLMPLLTSISAFILSVIQNRINPLQREQGRISQIATMLFSVGISLFLGAFVSIGVGLYWICSNLFTVLQQVFLNAIIPPNKHINYEELEKSKKALEELNNIVNSNKKKWYEKDPDRKREKEDYKRFFSIANKHLVFYSEKSGFYKYYKNLIEELLRGSNIIIHYVTSDPNDQIFELAKEKPRIKPYYIGKNRLITLMMKMDADMVVMTMPDLNNYHIKRSYIRKDVEYIYMLHGIGSVNLLLRKGALDHYDTIFCVGQHQVDECREMERVYNIPPRKLIPYGYGLIDDTLREYKEIKKSDEKKQILVAPSWQADNIIDSCIDEILDEILYREYKVFVRPHPEYIKRYPQKIERFIQRYRDVLNENFVIQTDFSSNETVYSSDILITDWSTISCEFSFTTKRPTLFINTPMKIMNPDYKKLGIIPFDISIREIIGVSLELNEVSKINEKINYLLSNGEKYSEKIADGLHSSIFNIGYSGEVGSKYIISTLINKQNRSKEELLNSLNKE